MLSNTEYLELSCLETEEPQHCTLKNDQNQECISQNSDCHVINDSLIHSSIKNGEIDGTFQTGRHCINGSRTIVVSTSGRHEDLADKTQIRNGKTTKTSQRRKNIKRMHANLSGTKYAVGMDEKYTNMLHKKYSVL